MLPPAVEKYYKKLQQQVDSVPQMQQLQQKTGIDSTLIVCGAAVFVFGLIILNVGGQLLVNLIGFVYPAYQSFKAIESAHKEDDVQWLTYWVVFAVLNLIEFFADIILYWLPFYYAFKTILVLWLSLPAFNGASLVYKQAIRPMLMNHQSKIDKELEQLKKQASDALKKD